MMQCSTQTRGPIFVKRYEILSFANNMGTIFLKNISSILRGKFLRKLQRSERLRTRIIQKQLQMK